MKSGWDKRKLTDWYICRQRWKRPEAEGRSKSGSNQRELHETVSFHPSSWTSTKQSKEKGIALGKKKWKQKPNELTETEDTSRASCERRSCSARGTWAVHQSGRGCATGDPSTITTTIVFSVEMGVRKTRFASKPVQIWLKLTWSDQ